MLGFDNHDILGAVGEKREVTPVGPQLRLRADQPGASNDQPPAAVGGLGDLRLTLLGVHDRLPSALLDLLHGLADAGIMRTPIEYCQPAFSSRLNTLVFQNPESALSNLESVANRGRRSPLDQRLAWRARRRCSDLSVDLRADRLLKRRQRWPRVQKARPRLVAHS